MGKKSKANLQTEIKNIKKAIYDCEQKLYFLNNIERTEDVISQIAEIEERLISLHERLNQKQNIGGIL